MTIPATARKTEQKYSRLPPRVVFAHGGRPGYAAMTPPPPPKPPETLYLIDGYASIFRAFYAIRHPLHSPTTGEPTQAVLVFAQMLLKLLSRFRPDYVVVALDAPGGTFRDALYDQYPAAPPLATETPAPAETTAPDLLRQRYKGNRRSTPDSLHQQVPRILELLGLCGVPVIGKPGLEADDVIATLTGRILEDPALGHVQVRIVSRDKDLEQLLSDRVALFDIHTEILTDVAALREKRGIAPEQVVDYLMLTGDAVDNIPGVAGIGPKTASLLVQQFGSVARVLENLDQLKGRQRESLEKARPFLPVSRELVTLRRDPEIPFSLEDARMKAILTEEIVALFAELGFNRLQEQVRALLSLETVT